MILLTSSRVSLDSRQSDFQLGKHIEVVLSIVRASTPSILEGFEWLSRQWCVVVHVNLTSAGFCHAE